MKYSIRIILAAIYLLSTSLAFAQQDELLPPELAFELQAWMDDDRLIAEYTIAPGYYMYRDQFDFKIASGAARFDIAIIPNGEIKRDDFLGEMEIFRDTLKIELPLLFSAADAEDLDVKVTGQVCADIGICYPPLTQLLKINTRSAEPVYPVAYTGGSTLDDPASSTSIEALQSLLDVNQNAGKAEAEQTFSKSTDSNSLSILQSIGDQLGLSDDSDIPHPDTAFQLSAILDKDNNIQTDILIYPKTYLYRDKIALSLIDGSNRDIGPVTLPSGDIWEDEFFGRKEVYRKQVKVSVPILSETGASTQYTLAYRYQGCVEDRICYPPITKYLQVNERTGLIDIRDQPLQVSSNDIQTDPTASSIGVDSGGTTASNELPISEQDQFTRILIDGSLLLAIALFFLAGIALTFTPCVFPMIPILSSIIAGQGESITTRKAFILSLVYVLSMATTYAIIGAIVGYYGAEYNIQIWFQDPWILSIFAVIFVLLALSMFGFYDLQIPNSIQSRLASISHSQQGGTLIGVGLMGLLSAIIVGPCITAPLVGALIFISQTQDWQLGGLALFALGLGMGVPLMLIGTSAGKLLPRAGDWMKPVKSVFGVILLAIAIWLLERFLPVAIIMILIACLVIASSIYMGALTALPASASGWQKLAKGLSVILLIYGASYLLGAAAGSRNLLQPLKGINFNAGSESTSGQTERVVFRQIKGEQGLQQALNNSVRLKQPTMLVFYADWCISCKVMEKYAFTHPDVLRALDNVATLQADVTDNDAIDTQLMSSLGIFGPPAILFYDPSGNELRERRVVGSMSGEKFAAHIIKTYSQTR